MVGSSLADRHYGTHFWRARLRAGVTPQAGEHLDTDPSHQHMCLVVTFLFSVVALGSSTIRQSAGAGPSSDLRSNDRAQYPLQASR